MLNTLNRSTLLLALADAGRFADPGEEGGGKGSEGDGGKPAGDGKPKGDEGKGDTVTRITTLVDERNTARQEAADFKSKYEAAQQQIEQLQSNDQSKVVTDLQKKLDDARKATATRFDKLLETELANYSDDVRKAVQAIPGGSEAKFDWLLANRGLFQAGGGGEGGKKDEGVQGPKHEKKPGEGGKAGPSSAAKAYAERAKPPQKSGFAGLQ